MSAVDKQGRFPVRYFKSELGNLLCSTTLPLTAQHQRQTYTVSSEFCFITFNPLRFGSTFRDHQVVMFTQRKVQSRMLRGVTVNC